MNRLVKLPIQGAEYVLNFSVGAAAKVYEKYGDTAGMQDALSKNGFEEEAKAVAFMLTVLSEQGAAYMRLVEGKEAPVWEQPEVTVVLTHLEFAQAKKAIMDAVIASIKPTVEAKPPKGKNAGTTQGK